MSLRINSDFNGVTDPDAGAYIAAVEAADGQLLEFGVGKAINDFVVGCKADGIWDAIKASCILAGARTRLGALTPLKGAAPTSFNFVDGDYNRKTGLVGNGSTKYLETSYSMSSDNLNNAHLYAYASQINSASATNQHLIGRASGTELWYAGAINSTSFAYRANETSSSVNVGTAAAGSYAWSRNNSTFKTRLAAGAFSTASDASSAVANGAVTVFARTGGSNAGGHRLALFSCGEALDLQKLDARVSALITAIGAAIP